MMMSLDDLFHQMMILTSKNPAPPCVAVVVVTVASLVEKVVGRMLSIPMLPPSLIDHDNMDAESVESMTTIGVAVVEDVVLMSMAIG